MSNRNLIITVTMGLAFLFTSAAPADAGGLLKRLFAKKRCCAKVTTCQPACSAVPVCCPTEPACPQPCVSQPPCCGGEVITTNKKPRKCGKCMRGNGVMAGKDPPCKNQQRKDEKCCERYKEKYPNVYKACLAAAKRRYELCLEKKPLPRDCKSLSYAECDCNATNYGCGDDPGCIYDCAFSCEVQAWCDNNCGSCTDCKNPPPECQECCDLCGATKDSE